MNHRLWSTTLAVAIAVTSVGARAADRRPNIHVLATGGTISGAQASGTSYGYKSGAFDVNSLLKTIPLRYPGPL
jgi:L-asparaginase